MVHINVQIITRELIQKSFDYWFLSQLLNLKEQRYIHKHAPHLRDYVWSTHDGDNLLLHMHLAKVLMSCADTVQMISTNDLKKPTI